MTEDTIRYGHEPVRGRGPLAVTTDGHSLAIGERFRVTFQRTLRIPDDGGIYPLPPGLGEFPIRRVESYADRVPGSWRERGGVFLPMYQREAMWMSFDTPRGRPVAVQIGIGDVCALTGKRRRARLNRSARRQNYVVCPDQPWLDGIHAGDGYIRQFVAMPLGQGYTVEGQVTGRETWGGVQLRAVEPKPGAIPDRYAGIGSWKYMACCEDSSMGLAAGGRMRQKVYPDPYGADVWDESRAGAVCVHIANAARWREITGEMLPPTPISAHTYTEHGFPWFDLYDEDAGDVPHSSVLAGVASVAAIDAKNGLPPQPEDLPFAVPAGQTVVLSAEGAGF